MAKAKSYAEQREAGRKLVQFWLTEDKWNQIKQAADSVEEPLTGWIKRAIFAALRKWEIPEVKSNAWPKCSLCGKHHNRDEHFKGE